MSLRDGSEFVDAGAGDNRVTIYDLQNLPDTIFLGEGNNEFELQTIGVAPPRAVVRVDAGSGNDKITTKRGDDYVNAGAGDNLVNTGGGRDRIITLDGEDVIDSAIANVSTIASQKTFHPLAYVWIARPSTASAASCMISLSVG